MCRLVYPLMRWGHDQLGDMAVAGSGGERCPPRPSRRNRTGDERCSRAEQAPADKYALRGTAGLRTGPVRRIPWRVAVSAIPRVHRHRHRCLGLPGLGGGPGRSTRSVRHHACLWCRTGRLFRPPQSDRARLASHRYAASPASCSTATRRPRPGPARDAPGGRARPRCSACRTFPGLIAGLGAGPRIRHCRGEPLARDGRSAAWCPRLPRPLRLNPCYSGPQRVAGSGRNHDKEPSHG